MRVSRQAGDLPAREFDRAVAEDRRARVLDRAAGGQVERLDLPAGELDRAVAGQSTLPLKTRGPETRAAGHVEERLVGAGAGDER